MGHLKQFGNKVPHPFIEFTVLVPSGIPEFEKWGRLVRVVFEPNCTVQVWTKVHTS